MTEYLPDLPPSPRRRGSNPPPPGRKPAPPAGPPDWRRSFNHENTNPPTGEPPLKLRRHEAVTVTGQVAAARVTMSPTAWRLGRRNGELVLQAGSVWHQGREHGVKWSDVSTVDLDNEAQP
jgi:hypothetical protein